ncbi:MAG TPA: hypothetical protein VG125_03045 [Pirellulales bacterium]|jgi:hypothetical protein|nr:hypothetical protein [Pirellulales bacterium]
MVDWIGGNGRRPVMAGVLTPCVAAVAFLGWRATLVRHVDEQRAVMQSISQQGGLFALDTDFLDPPAYGPPQWLRDLMGERFFSNIVSINLGATGITDENVKRLAKLPHLQSLGIWRTRTSDAALGMVAHLKELETLDISQTEVTDDGLKQLTRLPNIRVLVVGGDRITDQGLEHLERMSGLTMLCVVGDHFSTPAKKGLEQSLPDTTVIFVPLPQVAGGAPRAPAANPHEPAPKPQPSGPNQAPPGKKLPVPRGQFT